jgi:hypothetical protein
MSPVKTPKKLIEVALPLDAINFASAKEKSIRHGHPSTLHLWWARRPLAAARAVLFAQLVNDPGYERNLQRGVNKTEAAKERERLFRIIEKLVLWENTNNEAVLQEAQAEIWKSWRETCELNRSHPRAADLFNPEKLPAFHDPFAGGGAIPLEAQRLGLESYASDLNPVAVTINKATIEIPPKFAGCAPVGPLPVGERQGRMAQSWPGASGMAEDVRRYGAWMRAEAEKRIGHLYPKIEVTPEIAKQRPDLTPLIGEKLTVIAWLWARTVKSPNPAFSHVDIPLGDISGNQTVSVHFVMLPGGLGLAVIPDQSLQQGTKYTFAATSIIDSFGDYISVPTVSFTTQSSTPQIFDPTQITFSVPDGSGNVHISAPVGTLQPETNVLIIDLTSGLVVSFTAGNDGSLSGDFAATINDMLQITVTDPLGATSSFVRSQYVGADGSLAIGPGGGTMNGPQGTGLIVPEGAVSKGVTFKLSPFGADAFSDRPDVDGLNFGSGLTIQVTGTRQFNKEVKLIFPKPADAPDGAQYYVYRRVTLSDGSIAYEVIDHAVQQGIGDSAQVVTASDPFPGYQIVSSINGIDTFIVTWIFDPLFPNFFSQGAITGKVLSPAYQAGSATSVLRNVKGVHVYTKKPSVLDYETRKPVFATSQDNGTYVLWDTSFVGGSITVLADANSVPQEDLPAGSPPTFQTTAYEIQNRSLLNAILGKYRNVATGDITLPTMPASGPPPAYKVSIMQLPDGAYTDLRLTTSGIVPADAQLLIGIKASPGSPAVTQINTNVSVNGTAAGVLADPQGQFDVIANYEAGDPGVYSVQVTVLDPFGGSPVVNTNTFRVIGSGGSVSQVTPGIPPSVITGQSYPTDGATQVPVAINPLIVFSEPVTLHAGSILLESSVGLKIPAIMSGVDANGIAYADVTQAGSGTAYTSITLQPLQQLHYSTFAGDPDGIYQIILNSDIRDTNSPALALNPTTIHFSAYELPKGGAETDNFASPGIFVARNRAYVAKVSSELNSATVWMYDVSDPTKLANPLQASGGYIEGRADDVTGEDNSPVADGQTLVAVAQAPYPIGGNFQASNVYLYKGTPKGPGSSDKLDWIGAVSLTQGATDGVVTSIAVKGNRLYAATLRKGIQVVDLDHVKDDFTFVTSPTIYYRLNTEGQGFAQDAVLMTIGVVGKPDEEYRSQLVKVKVADYSINGTAPQTLAVATGLVPAPSDASAGPASFVVAAPDSQQLVARVLLQNNSAVLSHPGSLTVGRSLALGQIVAVQNQVPASLSISVVVGTGTVTGTGGTLCTPSCAVLAVVDMTDPTHPNPLSFTELYETPTDVLLNQNTAIVAYAENQAEFFDLSDPANPRSMGLVDGLGGNLFFYNGSTLYSSGAVSGDPDSALGGIHTLGLGTVTLVMDSNNNAQIDEAGDLAAKTANTAVAFWASDTATNSKLGLPDRENLLDYTTVRLKLGTPIGASALAFRLVGGGTWFIADKVGTGRSYLQDETTSIQQAKVVSQACNKQANQLGGECPGGAAPVSLPQMDADDHEFLFRCDKCAAGPRTLQIGSQDARGNFTVLDQVSLDIRPISDWMTVYNSRQDDTADQPPLAKATLDPAFAAEPDRSYTPLPTTAVVFVHGYNVDYKSATTGFAPTALKRLYWTGTPVLPPQGSKFFAFLWPGNVGPSPAAARFPWDEFRALQSGMPLATTISSLRDDGFSKVTVIAHSLGNLVANSAISSDNLRGSPDLLLMIDGAVPAEAFGPTDETQAMAEDMQYIDADMGLLGWGVTKGVWLAHRTDLLLRRAYSLGYTPTLDPQLGVVSSVGDDPYWKQEYDVSVKPDGPNCIQTDALGDPLQYGGAYTRYKCFSAQSSGDFSGGWQVRVGNTRLVVPPQYDIRWSQVRGNLWDQSSVSVPNAAPNRGPWAGFFAGNLKKTRIVNAFNDGDCVLNYVWYANQLTKPYQSLTAGVSTFDYSANHPVDNPFPVDTSVDLSQNLDKDHRGDGHDRQFWSDLGIDYFHESIVFNTVNPDRNRNIVRQWAELGLWFPSIAGPVGSASRSIFGLKNQSNPSWPSQWGNIDLTQFGNRPSFDGHTCSQEFLDMVSPSPVPSHSYMTAIPLSKVWGGYKLLWKVLHDDGAKDPGDGQ